MTKTARITLVLLLALFPLLGTAQEKLDEFNPVEYAIISQTISPDARGTSMGDAGAATDPDVNSQHWNPAKYPFTISRAGVALNYTPWLRQLVNDIDLAYLAGYYRIGDHSAVSGSLRYFSLGEVMTSEAENAMTVNPYEMAIDASYSLMLSEKFSIAATLRWIYSDLRYDYTEDNSPASAFSADLSAYYQSNPVIGDRECQLGIGMNISNIGSKITFSGSDAAEFLPTNLRIGAALMVPIDNYNRFSVTVDANKYLVPTPPTMEQYTKETGLTDTQGYDQWVHEHYNDVSSISGIFKSFSDSPQGFKGELKEIQWSAGAEYVYNDKFSLRAGYHHQDASQGNMKYFTVGAGFKMSVFSLDAGYVIATAKTNPLDQTLRLSLSFDMDGIKDLLHRR